MTHNARLAIVTCTPMALVTGPTGETVMEPLDVRWHRARMGLSYGTNINASEMCVDGLEIGDARSRVASRCRSMNPKPFCLFFLDSDVIVPNDAVTKLFYHLKTKPNIDIACGIYVCKGAAPYDPLIYQGNGMGAFWDFAVGDILTTKSNGITACHMGLTLIRTSLFDRLIDAGLVKGDGADQANSPFFKTENYRVDGPKGLAKFQGTEDIFFCNLGAQLDPPVQILVDSSVLAGHVDRKTGVVYGLPGNTTPIERAKWLPLPDGSGLRKDQKEAEAGNKILCVCEGGNVRSVGCAAVLKMQYGKDAVAAGWRFNTKESLDSFCKWADHILVMQTEFKEKIPTQYHDKVFPIDVGPDTYGNPYSEELQIQIKEKLADWLKDKPTSGLKLAIDLGAGESHREWAGHKTYRLDARKESNPDYCQEIENLNLPDNHYDLVASRHALEHVGRFQQEKVWSEIFRICKPGGKLEIIVPNLQWAAEKIANGEIDMHVYNVVFGGAESDPDMQESGAIFNIHRFGFTPSIAKALAENAGFVDVKITDWKTDPSMDYHMVIAAVKPEKKDIVDSISNNNQIDISTNTNTL